MIPTQEQIKSFWERFGFYYEQGSSYMDGTPYKVWRHPSNACHDFGYSVCPNIPLDLNSLFEYAVPLLLASDRYSIKICSHKCQHGVTILAHYANDIERQNWKGDSDLALALFWAIWEVIDNGH